MRSTLIISLLFIFLSPLMAEIVYHTDAKKELHVVSVNNRPLIHTAQITGEGADAVAQTQAALTALDELLKAQHSSLDQVVKLNLYLTSNEVAPSVDTVLSERFPAEKRPAISRVTTALPKSEALLAIDAVAAVSEAGIEKENPLPSGSAAILPLGARVYISGQAEKGDGTLYDATKQTLLSLARTLEFLGLGKGDVVQVKSFLTPMTQCADAEKALADFFTPHPVPPAIYVEWESTLPIEIEMLVAAPRLKDGPSLEVRTPPGMTTPTVYSRLTIVRHPVTLYTDGLYPVDPQAEPDRQLRTLFSQLKADLDLSSSSWSHLVKATYYVSDDTLNKEHNAVRPDYFNPRCPPAASKAKVKGVGRNGQGITQDFIAIPEE